MRKSPFLLPLLSSKRTSLTPPSHSYEENLTDTMLAYSTHPPHFISEVEVFAGAILGKNGAQSKRQREFSVSMKEKHERDVAYTVACIRHGDEYDDDSNEGTEGSVFSGGAGGGGGKREALERSIACLAVGVNTTRVRKKVGALVSFAWVAAGVCLREVERLRGG